MRVGMEFLTAIVFDPPLAQLFPRHEKVPPLLEWKALHMQRRPGAALDEEIIPPECLAVYRAYSNVSPEQIDTVRATLRRADLPPAFTDVLVREEMDALPVPLADCYDAVRKTEHVVAAVAVDLDMAFDTTILLATMPFVIASLLLALKNHHALASKKRAVVLEDFSVLRIAVGGGGDRPRQFYYASLTGRKATREPGADFMTLSNTVAYKEARAMAMADAKQRLARHGLQLATEKADAAADADAGEEAYLVED
jgi:hypothetical protein